jgi:hypothetical protein
MFSSPAGRARSQRTKTTTSRKFSQAVSTTGSSDHASGIQAEFLATRITAYPKENAKKSTLDKILRSLNVATRNAIVQVHHAISLLGRDGILIPVTTIGSRININVRPSV